MELERYVSEGLEIREQGGVKRLRADLIQEGRVASVRREVFAPRSLEWSSEGVSLRVGHGGETEVRSLPSRLPDGTIRVSARATPAMIAAVERGDQGMSIEFYSLRESRNRSGVREIQSAFLSGAAIVKDPEYQQGRAEVRSRRRRRPWL